MSVETIFQSRLLFVSGKGGVGKTSFAASLAKHLPKRKKKSFLSKSIIFILHLTSIFGVAPNMSQHKFTSDFPYPIFWQTL